MMSAITRCTIIIIVSSVSIIAASATSILLDFYGSESGSSYSVLDQGRINYIYAAWAPWSFTTTTTYDGLLIFDWSSDRQSSSDTRFGSCSLCISIPKCYLTLDANDYIIGYTVYYDSIIYGIELYTLQQKTLTCYEQTTPSKRNKATVGTDQYFKALDDFYYLSGWNICSGEVIDGIQFQFTHIATIEALINILPTSSFSATSDTTCAASQARYSSDGWCIDTFDIDNNAYLEIDFNRKIKLFSIATQGNNDQSAYVSSYIFWYSFDGLLWKYYKNGEAIDGNNSTHNEHTNVFNNFILAQYIRIYPKTFYNYPYIRVEAYGYHWLYDYDTTTAPILTNEPSTTEVLTSTQTLPTIVKHGSDTSESVIVSTANVYKNRESQKNEVIYGIYVLIGIFSGVAVAILLYLFRCIAVLWTNRKSEEIENTVAIEVTDHEAQIANDGMNKDEELCAHVHYTQEGDLEVKEEGCAQYVVGINEKFPDILNDKIIDGDDDEITSK